MIQLAELGGVEVCLVVVAVVVEPSCVVDLADGRLLLVRLPRWNRSSFPSPLGPLTSRSPSHSVLLSALCPCGLVCRLRISILVRGGEGLFTALPKVLQEQDENTVVRRQMGAIHSTHKIYIMTAE